MGPKLRKKEACMTENINPLLAPSLQIFSFGKIAADPVLRVSKNGSGQSSPLPSIYLTTQERHHTRAGMHLPDQDPNSVWRLSKLTCPLEHSIEQLPVAKRRERTLQTEHRRNSKEDAPSFLIRPEPKEALEDEEQPKNV
jgi:hypothetical protein